MELDLYLLFFKGCHYFEKQRPYMILLHVALFLNNDTLSDIEINGKWYNKFYFTIIYQRDFVLSTVVYLYHLIWICSHHILYMISILLFKLCM
jgi:hypothetical protein